MTFPVFTSVRKMVHKEKKVDLKGLVMAVGPSIVAAFMNAKFVQDEYDLTGAPWHDESSNVGVHTGA